MPDPSHRPYHPMTIIRPDSLPRLWWLFPWSMARQLHRNCNALRALCDRLDDAVNYWRIEADTDHARWLLVLEENDKLRKQIAEIDAAIIQGRAITPDAYPHE